MGLKVDLLARRLKTLLGVALIGLLVACGTEENLVEDAQRHYKQANSYKASGQFRAAEIEARNVLQKAPNSGMGHTLMASLLNELGRYRASITLMDTFPAAAEKNAEYVEAYATALLGREKYDSVLALLRSHDELESQRPAAFLVLRAQAFSGNGQVESAERDYQTVVSMLASTTDKEAIETLDLALAKLAQLAASQGNLTQADQLLAQLDEKNPDSTRAGLLRGKIAVAQQNLEEAEQHLTDTLIKLPNTDTITPERANILQLLSNVLIRQGRSAEALIYTQLLADAFPGYEFAQEELDQATQLYRNNEKDKALPILEKLVAEYPNFEKAALLLAVLRFENGDFSGAAELFQSNVDAEITNEEITQLSALSFFQLNQPELVLELLDPIAQTSESSQLLFMHGSAALALNNSELGLQSLSRSLRLDSNNVYALLTLARHYETSEDRDLKRALQYLERAQQVAPNDSRVIRELVKVATMTDDRALAQSAIDDLLKNQPNNVDGLILAGDYARVNQQFEEAAAYYQQASTNDSDNFLAALRLAELQTLQGASFDKNVASYMRAIELAPSNTLAYRNLIAHGVTQNRLPEVQNKIESFAEKSDEPAGLALLGIYYSQSGQPDTAEQYLEKFLAASGGASNTSTDQGRLSRFAQRNIYYFNAFHHMRSANLDKAKQSLFNALRADPQSPQLLAMLTEIEIASQDFAEASRLAAQVAAKNNWLGNQLSGQIALAQQQWPQASESFQLAWNEQPSEGIAEKLYISLENYAPDQAREFLSEWQATLPESTAATKLRARMLLIDGKYREAIPLMEAVRAAQPNDAQNLNNLAWAMDQVGNSEAADIAAEAYELAQSNPDIIDTYGWILHKQGEHAQAIALLEKANSLAPDNTAIAEHLAAARQAQAN